MKRGQGLPLNTIVLAALAVLVLLLVVGFTTGSLGKLFKGLSSPTSEIDEKAARMKCIELCSKLKEMASKGVLTEEKAENSEYATIVFSIDLDNDGVLEEDEIGIHCWQDPIEYPCLVTFQKRVGKCVGREPRYDPICSDITDRETCESDPSCKWRTTLKEVVCQPQGDKYVCK